MQTQRGNMIPRQNLPRLNHRSPEAVVYPHHRIPVTHTHILLSLINLQVYF